MMAFGVLAAPAAGNVSVISYNRSIYKSHGKKALARPVTLRLLCASSSTVILDQAHEAEPEKDQNIWAIKELFHGIDGSKFSDLSAYEMGWIARVPDASSSPQFPQSVLWILGNQCEDGSWGVEELELDRMCGTLSCLVALKTWNQDKSYIQKGLEFVKAKLPFVCKKLSSDGKLLVATMLKDAQAVLLELNYEAPYIQQMFSQREAFRNSRVSNKMLQEYPYSFVHILEAFSESITWEELFKYQCSDGCLFSLALTACAFMKTGNRLCLQYLTSAIKCSSKSDPSLLVENVRLIELLEHFGIGRRFDTEIQQTLHYAFRYWKGLGAAPCLEECALLFRVLRGHGFEVSPDVLHQRTRALEENTIPRSTRHGLYLASEFLFPGENNILRIPRSDFLSGISSEEMRFLLLFPWHSRIQRIEHIEYITKFGVSKQSTLLSLAKKDFNACQLIYQKDLQHVVRWVEECEFARLGYARQKEVLCYFAPAATMFEPEFSAARIVWAKMGVLTTVIDDYFDTHDSLDELRSFCTAVQRWDSTDLPEQARLVFAGLYNSVNSVTEDAFIIHKEDFGDLLRAQWNRLVTAFIQEAEWRINRHCPSMEDYIANAVTSFALEPITKSTLLFMGSPVDLDHPDCQNMCRRVSLIGRLLNDIQGFKRESMNGEFSSIIIYIREHPEASENDAIDEMRKIIEQTVKELVEDLLRPRAVPKACKRVFESMMRVLNVFYRDGDGFSSDELSSHVSRLLKT